MSDFTENNTNYGALNNHNNSNSNSNRSVARRAPLQSLQQHQRCLSGGDNNNNNKKPRTFLAMTTMTTTTGPTVAQEGRRFLSIDDDETWAGEMGDMEKGLLEDHNKPAPAFDATPSPTSSCSTSRGGTPTPAEPMDFGHVQPPTGGNSLIGKATAVAGTCFSIVAPWFPAWLGKCMSGLGTAFNAIAISFVKQDTEVLKSDMVVVKSDIVVLKSDMVVLKSDMVVVKEGVKGIERGMKEIKELVLLSLDVHRGEEDEN